MQTHERKCFFNLLYEILRQNFSYSIILVRVTNASCCRTGIFVRIFTAQEIPAIFSIDTSFSVLPKAMTSEREISHILHNF